MSKQYETVSRVLWDVTDEDMRQLLFFDTWNAKHEAEAEVRRLKVVIAAAHPSHDSLAQDCPGCRAFVQERDRIIAEQAE